MLNKINSFIGFKHETAGNLLIFISAFLWSLEKKENELEKRKNKKNKNVCASRQLKKINEEINKFHNFGVPHVSSASLDCRWM